MTVILAGDFNINFKDSNNAELVELVRDTSELDVLWDLSEGTTRSNLLRYGLWTRCGHLVVQELRFVLQLSETYLEHKQSQSSSTHRRNYELTACGNFKK
jgi:hypothetical protein